MKDEEFLDRLLFSTDHEFVGTSRAARFFLVSLSLVPMLLVLVVLLAVFLRSRRPPAGHNRDRAIALLKTYGGTNLSWMSTWPANSHFLTVDGLASVAYQVHAGTAVALGDPVGPPRIVRRRDR